MLDQDEYFSDCVRDGDPYGRRRAGPMRDREGESRECAIAVEGTSKNWFAVMKLSETEQE